MNNKAIIVYETVYNDNSLKIAKSMAQCLGCRYITSEEAKKTDLSKFSLIGFGSGIYFGKHHPKIFEIVSSLDSSNQNAFIFSSRGNPKLGRYHSDLRQSLTDKEKNILGEFSVRGYDETGPWSIFGGGNIGKPNEKDLKKANRFLQKNMPEYCSKDYYNTIKKKSPIKEGTVNVYEVEANKGVIVLKGDLVTINGNLCVGCGKCAKVCPMNVIDIVNGKALPKRELDCIICRLCVKNCPERAIDLHFKSIDAIKVAIRHKNKETL